MLNVGDIISNRYTILSHLGSGGMADVFECKDIYTKKEVAIKIVKEELLNDPKNLQSFRDEIRAASSMSHQNIVEIYEEGIYDNRPYLVMEYLNSQTLLDKLEYYTKFTLSEACEIMVQLLNAIQYSHDHKIIHRDVKPQNIFYLPNGTIKLADFGISSKEDKLNKSALVIGSVHYLAPEVITKKKFSIQSDIYAAGVTFYQLLTGRLPFDGTTKFIAQCQVKKAFPKPSAINPTIPKEVDEIISKAVRKKSKTRYRSANEFRFVITNYLKGIYKKESLFKRIFG